jgi:hypothetical protein
LPVHPAALEVAESEVGESADVDTPQVTLQVTPQVTLQVTPQVTLQVTPQVSRLLEVLISHILRCEMI